MRFLHQTRRLMQLTIHFYIIFLMVCVLLTTQQKGQRFSYQRLLFLVYLLFSDFVILQRENVLEKRKCYSYFIDIHIK